MQTPEPVRNWQKETLSSAGMFRYRNYKECRRRNQSRTGKKGTLSRNRNAQIPEFEMPMTAASALMTMPSCGISLLCVHEANIRGGGKTVHVVFKYLSRNLSRRGFGAARVTPPSPTTLYFPADPRIFHLKTTLALFSWITCKNWISCALIITRTGII
jgi:hypothetical protein